MAFTSGTQFARARAALRYTQDVPTGDVFFVDANNASASTGSGYGRSPDAPLTTIDEAIALCTAGDTIYVLPGHTENITTATAINCDVAGVTIEGLPKGNLMPTISTTAAAGSITVGAANVTIRNIKMVANFATGTTAALTIAAAGDGCTLDGVYLRDTSAANEFLVHVSVATTVTDLTIKNCSFVGLGGDMTNSILFAGTSTDCVIEDNFIYVDSSDDVIDHLAGASTNLTIRRNTVYNLDTDAAGYCVRYKSDGTGICHNNILAYNKNDAEITVGAAAWFFENYASNTVGESGKLDPANAASIP